MDNAVVPDGTVIAAGAVVLANSKLEPGIWAGVPAKKVKDASEAIHAMAHDNARHYLEYMKWYQPISRKAARSLETEGISHK